MWIRYFRLFFCFLLYINWGLLGGSVCFVSCTAGAGTGAGPGAMGLGLLVNLLAGWGCESRAKIG